MNDPEQENARWTLCYELSGSYLLVGMRCVSLEDDTDTGDYA